jgi:hypothetical protein
MPFKVGMWWYSSILLLRFNGDLLLINTTSKGTIIDTGVSDMCSSGYIKGGKFYGLFVQDAKLTTQLLVESTDPFLFIPGENSIYTCAATKTKLYSYIHDDPKCFSKSFDFKIMAIETTCISVVDVLLETRNFVVLDRQLSEMGILSDVLNISSNFIQTTQRYLLLATKFSTLFRPIEKFKKRLRGKIFLILQSNCL